MKTQQTTISEVSLIYKSKVKASDRPQVKCSRDAYNLFMEQWDQDIIEHVEEFKVMLMNRSNAVLAYVWQNSNDNKVEGYINKAGIFIWHKENH